MSKPDSRRSGAGPQRFGEDAFHSVPKLGERTKLGTLWKASLPRARPYEEEIGTLWKASLPRAKASLRGRDGDAVESVLTTSASASLRGRDRDAVESVL